MKTLRHQLLAKLHVLIAKQGADKEALYAAYGVTTARDLSDAELSDMVRRLGTVQLGQTAPEPPKAALATSDALKKKRSEILSLLTKSPRSTNPRTRGLGIPNDWQILNPWIERHAGALLFKLSLDDLEQFRKQLLSMRAKGWSFHEKHEKQEKQEQPTSLLEVTPIFRRGILPS